MRNLIMDFTHCHPEITWEELQDIQYIDCSDIMQCSMYCTPEAEDEIRCRLKSCGPSGIHFLDSGNYHYVTKFFLEKIKFPFSLILFDYHNDMQIPLVHDLTSCGSWAGEVLFTHPYLEQLVLIGPDSRTIEEIPDARRRRLLCVSLQELEQHKARQALKKIPEHIPLYISIDKDVLGKNYARTNWSQGGMSVRMLEEILELLLVNRDVIGADICGECPAGEALPKYLEDERINSRTNKELYLFLKRFIVN